MKSKFQPRDPRTARSADLAVLVGPTFRSVDPCFNLYRSIVEVVIRFFK